MSKAPDMSELGRRLNEAFENAAEGMRKFAEVWNDGQPPSSVPMLSAVQAKRKPTT